MVSSKVLYVPSPSNSSADELILAIVEIYHTALEIDFNDVALFIAALGGMSRAKLIARLYVVVKAAKRLGWETLLNNTSPFDDIDI